MDTWAWLALSNKKDKYHEAAKEEYNKIIKKGLTKLTSDYVLDETITALFRNVSYKSSVQFIESLFTEIENGQVMLIKVDDDRFYSAWSIKKKYSDKTDISFTDFTSFVIMKELGINKVFTGDVHFENVNMGFDILPK